MCADDFNLATGGILVAGSGKVRGIAWHGGHRRQAGCGGRARGLVEAERAVLRRRARRGRQGEFASRAARRYEARREGQDQRRIVEAGEPVDLRGSGA